MNDGNDRQIFLDTISNVSRIRKIKFSGLSFFDPYLSHYMKETVESGGELFVASDSLGKTNGIFIYDNEEKTGTAFTKSRDVLDLFFSLRDWATIFSEIETETRHETYRLYHLRINGNPINHRFRHEIRIAGLNDLPRIISFMKSELGAINPRWAGTAIVNGEKCFIAPFEGGIAGLAWVSNVDGIGRFHSLIVKPSLRKMGIGRDLLYARILWLMNTGATYAFSEISEHNLPSAKIAESFGMRPEGQVYQYNKQ